MLFPYFVYIAHSTKLTRESFLLWKDLCSWKIQKRKKVLDKKKRKKEKKQAHRRKKEYHSVEKRKKFLRETDYLLAEFHAGV